MMDYFTACCVLKLENLASRIYDEFEEILTLEGLIFMLLIAI